MLGSLDLKIHAQELENFVFFIALYSLIKDTKLLCLGKSSLLHVFYRRWVRFLVFRCLTELQRRFRFLWLCIPTLGPRKVDILFAWLRGNGFAIGGWGSMSHDHVCLIQGFLRYVFFICWASRIRFVYLFLIGLWFCWIWAGKLPVVGKLYTGPALGWRRWRRSR